jgi:hypothetical protein
MMGYSVIIMKMVKRKEGIADDVEKKEWTKLGYIRGTFKQNQKVKERGRKILSYHGGISDHVTGRSLLSIYR